MERTKFDLSMRLWGTKLVALAMVGLASAASAADLTGDDAPSLKITGDVTGLSVSPSSMPTVPVTVKNNTLFHQVTAPLLPSAWVGDYRLTVKARDAAGNERTRTVLLNYEPDSAAVVSGKSGRISIPAITQAVRDRLGREALVTEPFKLTDGSILLGEHEVWATMSSTSAIPLQINGKTVSPGETVALGTVSFAAQNGALSLPIAGVTSGAVGTSKVLFTTKVVGAPVAEATIEAWMPKVALNSAKWEVTQALDLVTVDARVLGGCTLTASDTQAKAGNLLDNPFCHLNWKNIPEGLAASGTGLSGRLTSDMPQQVLAYDLLVYDGSTPITIESGSRTMSVKAAMNAIAFGPDRSVPALIVGADTVAFGLRQVSGSTCEPTLTEAEAQAVSALGKLGCHVEWSTLPEGVVQDVAKTVPAVTGIPTALGSATVGWKAKAVLAGGQAIPLTEGSHALTLASPVAPRISLLGVNRISDDQYIADANGAQMRFTIDASNTETKIVVTRDGQTVMDQTLAKIPSSESKRNFAKILAHPALGQWTQSAYTVSVSYPSLPTYTKTQAFTVTTAPQTRDIQVDLFLQKADLLDTESTEATVVFGVGRSRDAYDAATMGAWQVRLVHWESNARSTPITEFIDLDASGRSKLSLDLSSLKFSGDQVRVAAEAKLISSISGYAETRISTPVGVKVRPGKPIAATIEAPTVSGPAPLAVRLAVAPENRDLLSAIGSVVWETSTDGGSTWVSGAGTTTYRSNLAAGEYTVRARTINRYSGAEATTPPINLLAFTVPTVELSGPEGILIGQEAKYTATVRNGLANMDPDSLVFEWMIGSGSTWSQMGPELVFKPTVVDTTAIFVRVRAANAPAEDRAAWVDAKTRLKVFELAPPKVTLSGPDRAMVGTPRKYSANIQSPFRGLNVDFMGAWTLPDGTVINGTTIDWAPTETELAAGTVRLSFTAQVAGIDATRVTAAKDVVIWQYVWPDWAITAKRSSEYAPTEITLTVTPIGYTTSLADLGNVQYLWTIPDGLKVTQTTGATQTVSVAKAGTYRVSTAVSNDRGNTRTVDFDLEVADAPPITAEIAFRADNDHSRAPLELTLRANVREGHRLDRIEDFHWYLNGVEVPSQNKRVAVVKLLEGQHKIEVKGTSRLGFGYQTSIDVDVKPNQAPGCSIEASERSSSWSWRAQCEDPDGRVQRHRWWVDDTEMSSSSTRLSMSKANRFSRVKLVGVDDAGAESAPVVWTAPAPSTQ